MGGGGGGGGGRGAERWRKLFVTRLDSVGLFFLFAGDPAYESI